MGQEFKCSLARWFWRLQSGCYPGCIWGLDWDRRSASTILFDYCKGFTSKVTHPCDQQVDAGFWQEALVLCHVDISMGLSESPNSSTWPLASPQSKLSKSVCICAKLPQLCLFVTLWTVALKTPLSMGILQARTLECVAMPSFRGSSQPRI